METFWKHFHCKKVFARLPSSKYLLSGLFPYFSFPVQCQHIGRKWMYDQHRTQDISHIKVRIWLVVQKYFLQWKTSLGFSGNPQWKMAYPALLSSVQPYISLIAHSYQLRHKAFPIRGRYQSQRRHLHPGQERLIFILICKGRLPTHTIIANEGIMWWWKCALFVAGEVANNWLEEQLNGQSKGGEWLCLHIWTDQR